MVSVAEAESIVLNNLFKTGAQNVALTDAVGCVLAETLTADRDFPPFNRVTMDGIAIAWSSLQSPGQTFRIEGTQAAGQVPLKLTDAAHAIEVMTGALLPEGTDTVIRYEDLDIKDGVARITVSDMRSGQNVHHRAKDAKSGDSLLQPGIQISPAEIALLASLGKSTVRVHRYPKTAIVSTGDELVDINEIPQAWQIRRSNSYALQAALQSMNHDAALFHLPDNKEALEEKLGEIFQQYELILLSGGVSKGKFDYVPAVLETLRIEKLFHRVNQRPGKPFWFGKSSRNTVFALPGNPVSTYLCFYRYIKPWLEKSAGIERPASAAILASDFSFVPDLTYFLQVKVRNEAGRLIAYPDEGGGSGDFVNLKDIDGFLELPSNQSHFKAGAVFPYFSFR